ncbi:MAG: U32 family peptidase [Bacteroidales bacterium]|nr:MAG: U32 family peptidase [Bacteroidales bacterium]
MAPAGSFESLVAAIQGKADSVYFGIERLNMRARSSHNFRLNDLSRITALCRENHMKSYLTLNTIIFDSDMEGMKEILNGAKKSGVNAVIASDQAVLQYAVESGLEVHISTQLNVSNFETLKFYARFADVVVLARELTLDQVNEITKRIKEEQIKGPSGNLIRIELFAHGALCMAVSGKCYLSLHESNHSANRGNCLQTCRKAYVATEKESGYQLEIGNEYIMSPKDLNTIGFIDEIIKAGVKVLKIEGRARAPEYVKTVVECYDEAVKACADGSYGEEKIRDWNVRLAEVFNRGFWDGYYLGSKTGEWSNRYGSRATKRKIYIGKITNYFSRINVAEFKIETGSLQVKDEMLISGPTTGVIRTRIKEIRIDKNPVKEAKKGDCCSIPVESVVRRSDKLYKIVDASMVKQQ